LINQSPSNDKIVVLRGQFPQNTFDTIISASDVVVLPYEKSGQSGILAHCYALYKPVVASNLISFKKSIERSKGGLLSSNDSEFITNIVKLLQDKQLLQTLKKNIKEYIKQDVRWGNIAKAHIKIYHSVVKVPYGKARHVFWE
jgi:1,2-diacylglycerol 3-alpha-glucosyltransferase